MITYTVTPIMTPDMGGLLWLIAALVSLIAIINCLIFSTSRAVITTLIVIGCFTTFKAVETFGDKEANHNYTKVVANMIDHDSSVKRYGKRSVPTGVVFYNTPDGIVSFNTGSGVPWPEQAVLYRYEVKK